MARQGKATAVDLATTLIAGIQKRLANVPMTFAGGTFTAAQVISELQELVDLRAAVIAARTSTTAKVEAEEAKAPALLAFMDAFVQFVRVQFSTQSDALADFGVPPKKVATPLTVEQKAAAAAKREATRAARGTASAKAKKRIKGTVTGVLVTPIVAGAPVVQTPTAPTAGPNPGPATGGTAPKTA
ncbi:MAG TPA: hypothetical protein VGL81_26315 [Polyangiaceae bacterium]|jgi:hypothetical protein